MTRPKIYVGVIGSSNTETILSKRRVFKTICNPVTKETHPNFAYVIGPFKTMRAATWCAEHPFATCQTVSEFEHIALVQKTQSQLCADYIKHLDK